MLSAAAFSRRFSAFQEAVSRSERAVALLEVFWQRFKLSLGQA
jgi:hypothetical protein